MGKSVMSVRSARREIVLTRGDERHGSWHQQVYHALKAFLGVPLALVLAFLFLGLALYAVERAAAGRLQPVSDALARHIFANSDTTGSFLDTIAGGFLTMTSIIVTMLLLVLQQTASNMGNLIFDQFLARRRNQLYTGLIVGTLVLALFVRTTVSDTFNPVLGATSVLVVSAASIILLLAFLYSTIEQMRPETIIRDIHQATLKARKWQLAFARRTRAEPRGPTGSVVELRTEAEGYLVKLDIEHLSRSLDGAEPGVEVLLAVVPGKFVAYYDLLAQVRAPDLDTARRVADSMGSAFRFASKREMRQDPGYGLEQLEMLAWTEISSAKQNPEVGVRAIHSLRDLLARWLMQDVEVEVEEPLPVVYTDGLLLGGLEALESLGVAALESQQHQVLAEVLNTVHLLFESFTPELADRAEELVMRLLPHLESQVLSRELDLAVSRVAATIERLGDEAAAEEIRSVRQEVAGGIDFPPTAAEPRQEMHLSTVREAGYRGERS